MDETNLDETNLSAFPKNDVYRLVCVPEDDSFGIFDAIESLVRSSEESEIYSSHGFAAWCEASASGVLRASSTTRRDEVAELFKHIRDKKDGNGHVATAPP